MTRSPQGTGPGMDWRSGLIIEGSYTARLLAVASDEYRTAHEFAALVAGGKVGPVRNQLALMVVGGLLIRRQELDRSSRDCLVWTYVITEMGRDALAAPFKPRRAADATPWPLRPRRPAMPSA